MFSSSVPMLSLRVLLFLQMCKLSKSLEMTVRLPSLEPSPESHVCTWLRMPSNESRHLVRISPLIDEQSRVTHHMMLYGCAQPASVASVYLCKMLTNPIKGVLRNTLSPCSSRSRVLYVWTRGTEELQLPSNVAFEVGGPQDAGDDVRYLVLQVHYADTSRMRAGEKDNSGLRIEYVREKPPFKAGIISALTLGRIAAGATTHMEQACRITQDFEHHPIAFRTHTHGMGKVVSGFRVRNNNEWTLLGKNNPQSPQSFLPVANESAVLRANDILATRCTMVNSGTWAQYSGSSRSSEMCDFYLLFYTQGHHQMRMDNICIAFGPPMVDWSGSFFSQGLTNMPDEMASTLAIVNMK